MAGERQEARPGQAPEAGTRGQARPRPGPFEFAVEVLQTIKSELLTMDAYQAGRIAGRVIGETLAAIVTAGIANATKGAILAQVSSKLKNVSYIADAAPVLNKLDEVAVIAEEIATTKQCFVAGTMVLTSEGLRPIETIRKGVEPSGVEPSSRTKPGT